MNRQDKPTDDKPLPLPSPTSPQALDDKVLAYARHKATQSSSTRKGVLGHPWATGLATASVVAVAVFITEPHSPAPSMQSSPATVEKATESTTRFLYEMSDSSRADGDMASDMPGKPAPKAKMRQDMAPVSGALAKEDRIRAAEPMKSEDRQVTLEHCAQLLSEGRAEEAETLYRQLRDSCPDCDLPDTLEAALDTNLEDN